MSPAPGARLGPYEVVAQIGAGGMGEVYRAHDTKLGRDVALKVLPEAFVGDEERLARFRREAHVLASLNHPNIAGIHGIEESGSTLALVMELVEGPTLADGIAHGPIPLPAALSIARQIADALASAHDIGIVHRDLKPANVKVRDDGTVKVLDFGLARAMDPATGASGSGSPTSLSMSPTVTSPMTQMGVILGTAAYMSPEQARGRVVDRRADIWAFGVTLYEMVTGRRLFEGEDLTETLAAVVMKPADLALVPKPLRRLLAKCLEKDPRKRLQAIGDWELLLDDRSDDAAATAAPTRARTFWPWVAGASALTAVVVLALSTVFRPAPPEPPLFEFAIDVPGLDSRTYSLSPDGRMVALANSGGGGNGPLQIRSLDHRAFRSLAGTAGAQYPFWSPDSRFIGFFAEGQLKRVSVDGGPAVSLADADSGRGGTWSEQGVILFAPGPFEEIMRVGQAGGEATPVTVAGASGGRPARRFPFFLPDGRHFLYSDTAAAADRVGVFVGSLDGEPPRQLVHDDTNAVYSPAPDGGVGHLLFVRDTTLMAQPFDPNRLELMGEPMPVAESMSTMGNRGAYGISVSAAGALLYLRGESGSRRGQVAWVDRQGNVQRTFGRPAPIFAVRLSPDDTRAALAIQDGASASDIWILDLVRDGLIQLTSDPGADFLPTWSPDGTQIAFTGERGGPGAPIVINSGGIGGERRVAEAEGNQISVGDWSPDARELLVSQQRPRTGFDILTVPVDEPAGLHEFMASEFNERAPRFSPDGRWVAYVSDEGEDAEEAAVYVRPYPLANSRTMISSEGGTFPMWSRDGKTLYYWTLGPQSTFMAVPLTFTDVVTAGRPEALFSRNTPILPFDVSRDGRFLMLLPTDTDEEATSDAARQFVFVSDWRR